ncbi:Tctex1 domain-containing protein 2, partial [Catenaria anguillulae PL171]
MNATDTLASAPATGGAPHHGDDAALIRPNYKNKFKPLIVQQILRQVLTEHLAGKQYSAEDASAWTRSIADAAREKLKGLALDRYKYIVHVMIGEKNGEGTRLNARCFWDPDTDNLAQEVYSNDSLFCVAVAFGVFY